MKKKLIDFKKINKNQWYDLFEDFELIDASFTTQYGIRLRNEENMSWDEFCTLLSGIMPKTPLGQIVSIRSEEDENILKSFSKEQHKIRDDWRSRKLESMSKEEIEADIKQIQDIFMKAFG